MMVILLTEPKLLSPDTIRFPVSTVAFDAFRLIFPADRILVEKVSTIEVLIAGNYMSKVDFDKIAVAIFAKLDKIEDKLDRKVDK